MKASSVDSALHRAVDMLEVTDIEAASAKCVAAKVTTVVLQEFEREAGMLKAAVIRWVLGWLTRWRTDNECA